MLEDQFTKITVETDAQLRLDKADIKKTSSGFEIIFPEGTKYSQEHMYYLLPSDVALIVHLWGAEKRLMTEKEFGRYLTFVE